MHEMSIVEALIEAVRRAAEGHPEARVTAVRVRIGALRLVVPDTLQFCYRAATRGTALADAPLEIEWVPARAHCDGCGTEFDLDEDWFECPCCHSPGARLLRGRELDLVEIELDEAAVSSA